MKIQVELGWKIGRQIILIMFNLSNLKPMQPSNIEYGLSQLRNDKESNSWHNAKKLHIHLISGIVCRRLALEIYPKFEEIAVALFNKDQQKIQKRSPYFAEYPISLGKRKSLCVCGCSIEYIADQYLIGRTTKVFPDPLLQYKLPQLIDSDNDYLFDGDETDVIDTNQIDPEHFIFSNDLKANKGFK